MMGELTSILAVAALAAAPSPLRPPQGGRGVGDYTLHDFASKWMMQQDDIAELDHYAPANASLPREAPGRQRIVMFGDSITAHWALDAHDSAKRHFVNRGIGGQNSTQMLLRFEDDVVALTPGVVVILAGTNDLRAYVGEPASVGPGALARVRRNVTAMADIADARGIAVILATIPPVGLDRDRIARDPTFIRAINAWLVAFAAERGYPLADYHHALADAADAMPQGLSADGIHPNSQGYDRMWPALEKALGAVRLPRPK